MPVGFGLELHRLVPGRRMILGGVLFEHPSGPLGHSDGDVVIHALIDALLGAMGRGDIGDHFPDTDPKWKDVSSEVLLKQILEGMKAKWRVVNADVTVIAEEPKLGVRKREIASRLAAHLEIDVTSVSVKGKTAEGLGPIGHKEAIAAMVAVQVDPR